jgi:hypothetical protein
VSLDWPPSDQFRDIDPATVIVECPPNGPYSPEAEHWKRFIGVAVGDNEDGTLRVKVSGRVEDFTRAVFRRPS